MPYNYPIVFTYLTLSSIIKCPLLSYYPNFYCRYEHNPMLFDVKDIPGLYQMCVLLCGNPTLVESILVGKINDWQLTGHRDTCSSCAAVTTDQSWMGLNTPKHQCKHTPIKSVPAFNTVSCINTKSEKTWTENS